MPLFSILISYRNREVERVARCLNSLFNQTYNDYEVIFIDYGSDTSFAKSTEKLVNSYTNFRYVYNDTRGMPWNQPHALNTALLLARGKYIVRLDVDLVLPPAFFEKLSGLINEDSYIHSKCYYLPKDFSDFQSIFQNGFNSKKLEISDESALGLLFIINRNVLLSINGFDEFYSYWGFDDLDISKRLIDTGKKIQWLDLDLLPVYHQWHPPSISKNPTGFLEVLKQHYNSIPFNNQDLNFIGKIYTLENRPALNLFLTENWENLQKLDITFPKYYYYSKFYEAIFKLKANDGIFIEYKTPYFSNNVKGKLANSIILINRLLDKVSFSYRLTDIQVNKTQYIPLNEVRDMICYLLISMQCLIKDYYFYYNDESVFCIVVKK